MNIDFDKITDKEQRNVKAFSNHLLGVLRTKHQTNRKIMQERQELEHKEKEN